MKLATGKSRCQILKIHEKVKEVSPVVFLISDFFLIATQAGINHYACKFDTQKLHHAF